MKIESALSGLVVCALLSCGVAFAGPRSQPAVPRVLDQSGLCFGFDAQSSTTVSGDLGYHDYENLSMPNGLKIDARGLTIYQQTIPVALNYGGGSPRYVFDARSSVWSNTACVGGGRVINTNPPMASWSETKSTNYACWFFKHVSPWLDGVHCYGGMDAFKPTADCGYARFTHSMVSFNRDDGIENDDGCAMLVDDVLMDGTYTGFSAIGGSATGYKGSEPRYINIRNSVIALRQFNEPYGHDDGVAYAYGGSSPCGPDGTDGGTGNSDYALSAATDCKGHSVWFKGFVSGGLIDGYTLDNVVLYAEFIPSTQFGWGNWLSNAAANLAVDVGSGLLISCKNVMVLWAGPGDFPGTLPTTGACPGLTVISEKDFPGLPNAIYKQECRKWVASHPKVPRVPNYTPCDWVDG